MSQITEIDLSLLSQDEVYVLSGRRRGEAAAKRFKVDDLSKGDLVKVIIPPTCYCMAQGFLLGMFGRIARRLDNQADFFTMFEFINDDQHYTNLVDMVTISMRTSVCL